MVRPCGQGVRTRPRLCAFPQRRRNVDRRAWRDALGRSAGPRQVCTQSNALASACAQASACGPVIAQHRDACVLLCAHLPRAASHGRSTSMPMSTFWTIRCQRWTLASLASSLSRLFRVRSQKAGPPVPHRGPANLLPTAIPPPMCTCAHSGPQGQGRDSCDAPTAVCQAGAPFAGP